MPPTRSQISEPADEGGRQILGKRSFARQLRGLEGGGAGRGPGTAAAHRPGEPYRLGPALDFAHDPAGWPRSPDTYPGTGSPRALAATSRARSNALVTSSAAIAAAAVAPRTSPTCSRPASARWCGGCELESRGPGRTPRPSLVPPGGHGRCIASRHAAPSHSPRRFL